MWTEGLLLAGLAAVGALALPRRTLPLVLLLVLPVAAVLLNPEVRLVSNHGFFHADIVYRILGAGLPPEDPHFAGAPLRYPWAGHALAALLVRILGTAPGNAYALLNLAALGATTVLLLGVARRLAGEAGAAALGVAVALYGSSLFAGGPLAAALEGLTGFASEGRATPIQKFANVQNNGLGLLGYALLLRAAVGLGDGGRSALLALLAATLVTALLYPLLWVAVVASAAAAAGARMRFGTPRLTPRGALSAGAVVILGSALALPYLLAIQQGRNPALAPRPVLEAGHLAATSANLALALVGLAGLAWLERGALAATWRRAPGPVAAVAACAATGALLFLAIGAPLAVEYKYLAVCALGCGLLAGAPLASLRARRPLVFVALLVAMLAPMGVHFARLAARPGAVKVDGAELRHPSPAQDALHRWVADHTASDAIFVDTELGLPTFARRPLFVALDPGAGWIEQVSSRRGWRMRPSAFLARVVGQPPAEIARRVQVTRALLDPGAGSTPAAALDAVEAVAAGRPAYLVARDPRAARRLAGEPRLGRVAALEAGAVFRIGGSREAAGPGPAVRPALGDPPGEPGPTEADEPRAGRG